MYMIDLYYRNCENIMLRNNRKGFVFEDRFERCQVFVEITGKVCNLRQILTESISKI